MKTRSILTVAGFAGSLLLAASATAGEQASQQFQQLDQDSNGQLSAVEASENKELSSAWSRVDKDSSGTIDKSEFSAFETMQEESPQQYQEGGSGGMGD